MHGVSQRNQMSACAELDDLRAEDVTTDSALASKYSAICAADYLGMPRTP